MPRQLSKEEALNKNAPLTASQAHKALISLENPEKAKFLAGFFKTGKGQYGEGDRFLGITVPLVRNVVHQFKSLPLSETEQLLQSIYNEERLLALLIFVEQYQKGENQEAIYELYLKNRKQVNNWNLVDASAPLILGAHLLQDKRDLLLKLAKSKSLWDRRIAIVSTFAFIRNNEFDDTLKITELLLGDSEDLLHKACGWMLREVGKRNTQVLEQFLQQYGNKMPRTMLRYAIERFPEVRRKQYLTGRFI